jgi:hypothetical protein
MKTDNNMTDTATDTTRAYTATHTATRACAPQPPTPSAWRSTSPEIHRGRAKKGERQRIISGCPWQSVMEDGSCVPSSRQG